MGDVIDAYDELREHGHLERLGLEPRRELVRQELRKSSALLTSAAAGADDVAEE